MYIFKNTGTLVIGVSDSLTMTSSQVKTAHFDVEEVKDPKKDRI